MPTEPKDIHSEQIQRDEHRRPSGVPGKAVYPYGLDGSGNPQVLSLVDNGDGTYSLKTTATFSGSVAANQQYADGASATTPTGIQAMWNEGGVERAVSSAKPLPVTTSAPSLTTTTATLSSATSVTLALPSNATSSAIQLVSSSFVGTIIFETSEDGGTTYNARVYRGSGVLNNLQTTLTNPSTGDWRGSVASMTHVRVRCSAYTSGSLTVTINVSPGSAPTFLNAPIPIGGQSTGNTFSQSVGAGATVTGTYENMENVASISINLSSTQNGTFTTNFSQDGSTLFSTSSYPITAGTPFYLTLTPARAQYFQTSFTNNGASSATLSQEVLYRAVSTDFFRSPLGASSLLTDALLVPAMKAVMAGRITTDSYVDARYNSAGTAINTLVPSVNDGGVSTYRNMSLSNTAQLIKGSAGQVYGWTFGNPGTATAYIHLYNAATAGAVAVGTTTPVRSFPLYSNSSGSVAFDTQLSYALGGFTSGIVIAATSTATGSAAPATAVEIGGLDYA